MSRQPFQFPRSLWVPDASFEGQQTAEGQESLIQERRPLNNHQSYQINKFQGVDRPNFLHWKQHQQLEPSVHLLIHFKGLHIL